MDVTFNIDDYDWKFLIVFAIGCIIVIVQHPVLVFLTMCLVFIVMSYGNEIQEFILPLVREFLGPPSPFDEEESEYANELEQKLANQQSPQHDRRHPMLGETERRVTFDENEVTACHVYQENSPSDDVITGEDSGFLDESGEYVMVSNPGDIKQEQEESIQSQLNKENKEKQKMPPQEPLKSRPKQEEKAAPSKKTYDHLPMSDEYLVTDPTEDEREEEEEEDEDLEFENIQNDENANRQNVPEHQQRQNSQHYSHQRPMQNLASDKPSPKSSPPTNYQRSDNVKHLNQFDPPTYKTNQVNPEVSQEKHYRNIDPRFENRQPKLHSANQNPGYYQELGHRVHQPTPTQYQQPNNNNNKFLNQVPQMGKPAPNYPTNYQSANQQTKPNFNQPMNAEYDYYDENDVWMDPDPYFDNMNSKNMGAPGFDPQQYAPHSMAFSGMAMDPSKTPGFYNSRNYYGDPLRVSEPLVTARDGWCVRDAESKFRPPDDPYHDGPAENEQLLLTNQVSKMLQRFEGISEDANSRIVAPPNRTRRF